jgi:hypothetical protein
VAGCVVAPDDLIFFPEGTAAMIQAEPIRGRRLVERRGGNDRQWFVEINLLLQADPQSPVGIYNLLDFSEQLFLRPVRERVLRRLQSEAPLHGLKYLRDEVARGRKELAIARAKATEAKAKRGTLIATQPANLGAKLRELDREIAAAEEAAREKAEDIAEPERMLTEQETVLAKKVERFIAEETRIYADHMAQKLENEKKELACRLAPHIENFLRFEQANSKLMAAMHSPLGQFQDLVGRIRGMTAEELDETVAKLEVAKPETPQPVQAAKSGAKPTAVKSTAAEAAKSADAKTLEPASMGS